tara:strand:+ start:4934 stop:9490 length:4557 start_codon:yes stop_codon:yes gene_type:complete
MATTMDLAKNEAVDNNVVTDNVLTEQMEKLNMPVVAQNTPVEVYEEDVNKDIDSVQVDEEAPVELAAQPEVQPVRKPVAEADVLAAGVSTEEPVYSPVTKEEFAVKREEKRVEEDLKDRATLLATRAEKDNLQLDLLEIDGEPDLWLFTLLDEDGNVADTYTMERGDKLADKRVDAIFKKTKADIDRRDLKTLGAMPDRPQTLTRMITQNLLKPTGQAALITGAATVAMTSLPAAGLVVAGLATNMLVDPEAEVLWGTITPGDMITVGESLVAFDKFERWLRQGPLGGWIADDAGQLKPLALEEADALLDRPAEGLAFHLVALNVALETVGPSLGFIGGLKLSARESSLFMKKQKAVYKDLQEELKKEEIDRAPTAAEVAKRMESEIRKMSKDSISENGDNTIKKLYRWGTDFKRGQINNIKNNPLKYYSEFSITDGTFVATSVGLAEYGSWEIGGGANVAGSMITSIFSGPIASGVTSLTANVVEGAATIVEAPLKAITRIRDPEMARKMAIDDLGEDGFAAAIEARAQKSVGAGNTVTNAARLDADEYLVQSYRGGLDLQGIVRYVRGETTLADLNLPPKQVRAAEDFMKNVDALDPQTRLDVIRHVTKALEVSTALKEMGVQDPEQGFGLLFGLNTLRAIEPEMIMQGVARRSVKTKTGFKETLLKQVTLEDYYAQKVRYTKQLQNHYENLLAAKRKNLIGATQRSEVIRTEVDSHLEEVRVMLGTLQKEQIQSTQLVKDLIKYTAANAGEISGNRSTQNQIRENIKVLKVLNLDEAADLQKQYDETWVKETNNQIIMMKEATDGAKKAESSNKVIVATINKRVQDVQDNKNTLYTAAGEAAVNEVVDGTELVRELNRTFSNIPKSEQFAGGVEGVMSDLDDILSEPAKKYIARAAKTAGVSESEFKSVVKEAIKIGDPDLSAEIVADIVDSPTQLLMYLADADTQLGGILSEIPAFKFSGQDLKNIELGLSSRINKGGEFVFGQSGKQKAQLQGILAEVKDQVKTLEASGQLDLTKWKLANAENVKYHDILATDIISNTWGTRVRSVGPEENWKYKTKQEKWADKIVGSEDIDLAEDLYNQIDMIFGDSEQGKQFYTALSENLVAKVQARVSKGVDFQKLEPEKLVSYGSEAVRKLNPKAGVDALPSGNYLKMHKTLEFIRELEIKSNKKFNFERAYDFETRLNASIKKSGKALDSLKYAETQTKVAKENIDKLYKTDTDTFIKLYEKNYGDYKNFRKDPSLLLNAMEKGELTAMKKVFTAPPPVGAGMDAKAFDRHVQTLFVEGFTNQFTLKTGQVTPVDGKLKNIKVLNGQDVIDYLDKNEKVIKEFMPDVNIKALRYIADATALKTSGDVIEREGIDSVTSGLAKLTIGSYVSRLYAVASNRTSLRYVGAEALVVQMKRDEISVLAALMMNPKAAEKIAEIIKSGKPMSHRITTSEAAWLPNFMGQVQAISERNINRMMGYDDEQTKVEKRESSSLPFDEALKVEAALDKKAREQEQAFFAQDIQDNITVQ